MTYLLAFAVSFLNIGLRALQQRHVMHAQYWRMPPASMAMAFCEVFLVGTVAISTHSMTELIWLALAIGSGSGLGSMFGTYVHARKHAAR